MLGKAFRKGGRRDDTQDREKDSPSLALPHALFVLQDKTLLKSNLAAFRTISEKFINVSSVVSSISKNLDYLEVCEVGEGLSGTGSPRPQGTLFQVRVHGLVFPFSKIATALFTPTPKFLPPLLPPTPHSWGQSYHLVLSYVQSLAGRH